MSNWPLVGRAAELAYLVETINDPVQQGVFLAGVAGVGKTRLLAEVATTLEGCHVERATATHSAQQLPFGALASLLAEGATSDRADFLARTGAELRRRAKGRPVVLMVDDAHLLDQMSAAFVHYAATSGLARTVVSVRSGESAPDAVTALYRDGVLPRLELQPISRAEFDDLVAVVLDGPVENASLERLWAAAAGNVLFVRELIADATEAGTLSYERGSWRWAGRAGAAVRLREVVFNRIGQLSPAQRHLLDLLAIAEPLGVTMAAQLAPDASIDDAERRGLVTVSSDRSRVELRLAHPLFGEALQPVLSAADRRRIHHQLADALEATGARRRDDILRLALWRLEAGDPTNGDLLTDAAQEANRRADPELAERLARAAVNTGAAFNASLQLGRALSDLGRHTEAEATLAPLVATDVLTDEQLVELADARVLAVGHGLGYIDDAIAILVEAEGRVTHPEVRALLQAHRAALLSFAARFGEAATVGGAALELVSDDATRVRSISSVGTALVMAGQFERALELSDELLPIALDLQDQLPRAPFWVASNRATAYILSGRFDEALDLIDFVVAAVPTLDAASLATVSLYQGRIALGQGKPATARRRLADALVAGDEGGLGALAPWGRSLHAEACALLGDTLTTDDPWSGSDAATDVGHPAYDADSRRARAWVDALAGRTSEAVAELVEAAAGARARGQAVFELLSLCDALRLGARELAERTKELAQAIDGPWAAAIGSHAAAVLAGDDPDLLTLAASAFEAMGSHLVAAELLAVASGGFGQEGLRAKAADATRRSREQHGLCEGAHTPLLDWASDPLPLSRREREVAALAAQNQSNADIAAALHISVRTVESHLYSAYAKLGVTQRDQLAQVLGR